MWPIVIGFVLICLDQTWYDSLCWYDIIVVKNLKDSKIFKFPKNNSKLQEGCHLRKKIQSSKERFKKFKERLKLKKKIKNFKRKDFKFQKSKRDLKGGRKLSKMDGFEWWISQNDVDFLK